MNVSMYKLKFVSLVTISGKKIKYFDFQRRVVRSKRVVIFQNKRQSYGRYLLGNMLPNVQQMFVFEFLYVFLYFYMPILLYFVHTM